MEFLPIVVVAGVFALIGFIIYLAHLQQKRRTEAMRALAARLGWGFEEKAPLEVVPRPERFELFTTGRNRRIRNFLSGELDGLGAAVFDYTYVTGSGKSTQTWTQTVLYLHAESLDLPSFSLRPENVFHRIAGAFGYQDIDLPHRPDFSRKYLLRGPDEGTVRAAFGDDVVEFYEGRPKCCTEAQGKQVFVWRASRLLRPEEVPGLLDEGRELVARLQPEHAPERGGVS
ncbi:MAG TPA: hypothetical protein VHG91_21805 [Longimicrobium sp.]|nr:hypothetical protein [Longimicrobium sp.]